MRLPSSAWLLLNALLTGAAPAAAETWRLVGSESPPIEWAYADGGFSRSGTSAHYVRQPGGERFDVQFTWQVPQALTEGVAAEVQLTADVVAGWPCRALFLGARVFLAASPCAFCADGRDVGAGICAEHAQGTRTFRVEPGNFGQAEVRLHVHATDGSLFGGIAATYVYARDAGPPTATATRTRTPSSPPTPTATHTRSPAGTPSATATQTRTPSRLASATVTRTRSPAGPPTASRAPTRTPTEQPTATPTIPPTRTPTGSQPGDLACGETREGLLDAGDLPFFDAVHAELHYFTLSQTTDVYFAMDGRGFAPYLELAYATYPYAYTRIVGRRPPLAYRLEPDRYAIAAGTLDPLAAAPHAYTLTMICDGEATATATPSRTTSPTPSRTPSPSPSPTVAPPTATRVPPTRTGTPTPTAPPARTATPTLAGCAIPSGGALGPIAGGDSSGCTDLVADAIEIVQSIQDLDNSIPLIAGKPTFVRFHVHAIQGAARATARLRVGATFDDPLAQELKPINGDGYITVVEQPDRAQRDAAFLFKLPTAFLGYEDGDRIVLEAEVDPADQVAETTGVNNTYHASETVRFVPPLQLLLYHVGYHGRAAPTGAAEGRHARLARDWLAAAYPVPDVELVERSLPPYAGRPTCETLNYALLRTRLLDRFFASGNRRAAIYYAMVFDRGDFAANFVRGETFTPPLPGSGWLGASCGPSGDPRYSKWAWDTDETYGDWYAGHEVGHALDQEHPGVCPNEDINPLTGPGPHHVDGLISAFQEGREAVVGHDARNGQIYSPARFWTDMMTYCPRQWISDLTYGALFRRLRPAPTSAPLIVPVEDHLLISGSIDLDSGAVDIAPLLTLPGGLDLPTSPPGPFLIVLRSADGEELASHHFTPGRLELGAPGGTGNDVAHRRLGFAELLPAIDGTARVEVEGLGVFGSVRAGPAAPHVTLLSPNGGEVLAGETARVTWRASDADGDALAFTLQYSPDDGATWEVVAPSLSGTTVDLAALDLTPTETARFRVWVSDGIHSADDTSDGVFRVANRPPRAWIVAPADGAVVARGQTLTLVGEVADEGGPPPPERLAWRSDRDGSLGTGRRLALADLSVGTHLITLRADDGAGGVTDAQVRVVVVAELTDLPSCVGDCSGDGTVTVEELVAGVGIAVGARPPAACPPFDADGDGAVRIDELIAAVNAALDGCGRTAAVNKPAVSLDDSGAGGTIDR